MAARWRRGPRAAGGRRGAPDAAVRRPGLLVRRARRRQPGVEARRRPARRARALLDTYEQRAPPHVACDAAARRALIGGFVQATTPARRARCATRTSTRSTGRRSQRVLAENVKPLPTYGAGAFATSARAAPVPPHRRLALPPDRPPRRPARPGLGGGRERRPLARAARGGGPRGRRARRRRAWLGATALDLGAAAPGPLRLRLRRRSTTAAGPPALRRRRRRAASARRASEVAA